MDFDLRTLIPFVIAILFLIFGGARRRKPAQRSAENSQRPTENRTEVDAPPDREVVFPPFMENFEEFPSETELAQETVVSTEANIPMVTEQSVPVQEPTPERKRIELPPVPVDSPTPLPTKSVPATSLIGLSPDTFRQGIILAEILGRPKGLQSRRR